MPSALVRRVVAAFLVAAAGPIARAQHVLITEHKKKTHVVRRVSGSRPFVEIDGKLTGSLGHRFALHKVEEYFPVFISVRNVRVRTTRVELAGSGSSINHQFEFAADFASSFPVQNVFLALALHLEDGSRNIFVREIGRLDRNRSKSLDLAVPTGVPLGSGQYKLHIFVDGLEVLHSQQPFAYREAKLDRFVKKRLKDRPDGQPEPFIGPPPEYPRSIEKPRPDGKALVRLRILPTGAIADASVLEASHPAFGESAVEALRQWRFIPRIQSGRPVETTVNMPVAFESPDAAEKS